MSNTSSIIIQCTTKMADIDGNNQCEDTGQSVNVIEKSDHIIAKVGHPAI